MAVTGWIFGWFSIKASDRRIDIRREMNEADNDSMSKAVDSLLNYETVKYFNAEQLEVSRYDRAMARYANAATRTYTSLAWLNFGQAVIFSIGMIACVGLSVWGILAGKQTVGDFVMTNALMMQLSIPLNFIGTLYREIKQSLVDIEHMFAVIDVPAEVVDKPGAPDLKIDTAVVTFENVSFGYDPDRQILNNVSFTVPAGRTVAIVGPSGAGKSTISRLLFRFYDVGSGRILIDGQDIRDVKQSSLRRNIGMVPQDTVLFNDTIKYNIRYGRQDASEEEEIQTALDSVSKNRTTLVIAHRLSKVVNADEILVLDQGVVVERGRHAELIERAGLYASMWERQRAVDEARERLKETEAATEALGLKVPKAAAE
eukprot:gene21981-22997_t